MNSIWKLHNKSGMTLAEVLITLGIIGVVAAFTIPTLIRNNQNQETEVQLKKSYSIFNQFFEQFMVDEGCTTDLICTGLFDLTLPNNEWQDKMDGIVEKYFKIIKVCKNGDTSCSETVKYIKGTNTVTGFTTAVAPTFITVDGIMFNITNYGCAATAYPNSSKIKNLCGWMLVDINGFKPPNTLGLDVFGFGSISQNGGIYPDAGIEWAKGAYGDSWAANANYWRNRQTQCGGVDQTIAQTPITSISGQNCLARIMENDWVIDYK